MRRDGKPSTRDTPRGPGYLRPPTQARYKTSRGCLRRYETDSGYSLGISSSVLESPDEFAPPLDTTPRPLGGCAWCEHLTESEIPRPYLRYQTTRYDWQGPAQGRCSRLSSAHRERCLQHSRYCPPFEQAAAVEEFLWKSGH